MRGRTCGAVAALACLAALVAGATESGFRLYNVVPMYLGHEAEQAAKSVEMYERTGEDLALYSLTLHPSVPPTVFYAYADMGVEIGPRDPLGPVGKHLPALPTLKLSVERWPIYPMDFKDRYVSNGFACSSGPCGTRTERYLI